MRPRTKEERVYDHLKMLILSGELPRDEFLSQRMLAQRANTNITTVRTALRQLESDGLMENVPHWGVRIPAETEEGLRDLYFMRELLEVGAVRRLVQNRNSIDVKAIVEKARHCDALARKLPDSIVEFSKSHFDFHMELARQSRSALLVQSLNRIQSRSWLLSHDLQLWTKRNVSALARTRVLVAAAPRTYRLVSHEKMVDVILNSSEDVAASEMRKHVHAGLQRELNMLRKTAAKSAKQLKR